jgi:hypothetical protein
LIEHEADRPLALAPSYTTDSTKQPSNRKRLSGLTQFNVRDRPRGASLDRSATLIE